MVSTRSSKMEFKFSEGERVLCFEPDPTKARVLYDAKVLEVSLRKDGKGKKGVEYLIHFQGWNSSWDRFVKESFVLQDSPENRQLQKELAVAARSLLQRRKRRRIGSLKGAEPPSASVGSGGGSEASVSDGDADSAALRSCSSGEDAGGDLAGTDDDDDAAAAAGGADGDADGHGPASGAAEEEEEEEELYLAVPEPVRQLLEEDCFHIKHYSKVVRLPCQPDVVTLLEGFVRNLAVNLACKTPEKSRTAHRTNSTCSNASGADPAACVATSLALCKEVVDGLRVAFDFLLPLTLLYDAERPQYRRLHEFQPPPTSPAAASALQTCPVVDNPLVHEAAQWRLLPEPAPRCSDAATPPPPLPCRVYGLVHLLRLLVRLPDVLHKLCVGRDKKLVVVHYAELLLQYLARQTNLVDADAGYVSAHQV